MTQDFCTVLNFRWHFGIRSVLFSVKLEAVGPIRSEIYMGCLLPLYVFVLDNTDPSQTFLEIYNSIILLSILPRQTLTALVDCALVAMMKPPQLLLLFLLAVNLKGEECHFDLDDQHVLPFYLEKNLF